MILRPISSRFLSMKPSLPSLLSRRTYYTPSAPVSSAYSPAESKILSQALSAIPKHGFTESSLLAGVRAAEYPDVSINLFPRGVFDLIIYHLSTQREALKTVVETLPPPTGPGAVSDRIRALTLARLRGNASIINHWSQALAIMAQPSFLPASLRELHKLTDEILYLAGDTSVDSSWYTKRAALSAVYVASEGFMMGDKSPEFAETEGFLTRRLGEVDGIGTGMGDVRQWVGVTLAGVVNVARSKGVRI